MKFVALIIIFICISSIGIILGNGFKFRVKELQEFENIYYSLKNNIIFMRTPIAHAIKFSCNDKSELGKVLIKISNDIEKGEFYNLVDIANKIFELNKSKLYLNQSDLEMICDFFANLENNNLDSFENIFSIFTKRINDQIKDAIELKNKNNKVYRVLGIGVAAMIVIFLI